MSGYQLHPLKNEKQFEEFICDLFNEIENTKPYPNTDYQMFGVKGQQQKGIDILSQKSKTVVQCKLKDIRKSDELIRKALVVDIDSDLLKMAEIDFEIKKVVFASTFRDDAKLQEYVVSKANEMEIDAEICYWGWDTVSKYAQRYPRLIEKYFSIKTGERKDSAQNGPAFLPRIQTGKELVEIVKNAYGYGFDHDELENKDEADMIGAFFDNVEDWSDVMAMGDFSKSREIELSFTFGEMIKNLENSGFLLFGEKQKQPLAGDEGSNLKYDVAVLYAIRKTNPLVIKLGSDLG